jgi:hypothetical protein
MKTVAWTTKVQHAWSRFLGFIVLFEESMDGDFVAPLYRRVDALERETDDLRGKLARAFASDAEGSRLNAPSA